MLTRKYYNGRSAPPAVIIRFLEKLGFRLQRQPRKSRCYFYASRVYSERVRQPNGTLEHFPIILPHPLPGQTAISGGVIDYNVFEFGIDRGLLPAAEESLRLWDECVAEVNAAPDTLQQCVYPAG